MSSDAPNRARVIPLRPATAPPHASAPPAAPSASRAERGAGQAKSGRPPVQAPQRPREFAERSGSAEPGPHRRSWAPEEREQAEPRKPAREPLWRDVVGDVLRRERRAQERTLKDVAEAARISMPYLSELERGRKEASSEVLAAAARALGLGLADLLGLVQGELARVASSRPAQVDTAPTAEAALRLTSRHDLVPARPPVSRHRSGNARGSTDVLLLAS